MHQLRTTPRPGQRLPYMIHIDAAGPYQEVLGGSRYVVLFIDSASRLPCPCGTRDKCVSTILGVVESFVADVGIPCAIRTDSGAEYTNSMFADQCNGLGIRHELTVPYTLEKNGPMASGLSKAIKAGRAARIELNKLLRTSPSSH